MIDTRQVQTRRTLHLDDLDEILADAEAAGGPDAPTTGNWTAAQIVQHVARALDASRDGFGFRLSLPMRVVGRLLRSSVLRKTFRAGIRLRGPMTLLEPDADVTWETAIGELRRGVQRVRDGERLTAPSPLFGALSHEQWVALHCRHAELHFGFMGGGGGV